MGGMTVILLYSLAISTHVKGIFTTLCFRFTLSHITTQSREEGVHNISKRMTSSLVHSYVETCVESTCELGSKGSHQGGSMLYPVHTALILSIPFPSSTTPISRTEFVSSVVLYRLPPALPWFRRVP